MVRDSGLRREPLATRLTTPSPSAGASDKDEGLETIQAAIDAGVNFIDTAYVPRRK
jgi:aryl-alcohol dehydrogenase-like predicted oxidoreductase